MRSPRMARHNRTGPSSGSLTPIGQFHGLIIRSLLGLKQIERSLICISSNAERYIHVCVFILITWICEVPAFIRHDKDKRHKMSLSTA